MAYIKNVEIRNFKSIKGIEFSAKKVNVFIGDANTGKSNILKAIDFIVSDKADFEYTFYNQDFENTIHIKLINSEGKEFTYEASGNGKINIKFDTEIHNLVYEFPAKYREEKQKAVKNAIKEFPIKLYQYSYDVLVKMLAKNPNLVKIINNILEEQNLKLYLIMNKYSDNHFVEILKEISDGAYIHFRYHHLSENLSKFIFYFCVIRNNSNSILLLDDVNFHPAHSKLIGETIALDETNQFFISTSDAYLLNSLVEKTNKNDISVFNVYYDKENNETKIKQIDVNDILKIGAFNIFFNLD
jgi:predicted ATP-dependent endonuclease of OLD family